MTDTDRQVHAVNHSGSIEIVRYDREGRWYAEGISSGLMPGHRMRLATVHDAVRSALIMESEGGQIFEGKPGGRRFDYMVAAAHQKRERVKVR